MPTLCPILLLASIASRAAAQTTGSTDDTSLICPGANNTEYQTLSGEAYTIRCDVEHFEGNMNAEPTVVGSFSECIESCDNAVDCVSVSYRTGFCFLKSSLGALVPTTEGVRSATLSNATTPPAPIGCPESNGQNYTTTSGSDKTFSIECGIDYLGGDMGNSIDVSPLSGPNAGGDLWLQSCAELCGNTTACVGAVQQGTQCYLKSSLGNANASAFASALRLVDAPVVPVPSPSEPPISTTNSTTPTALPSSAFITTTTTTTISSSAHPTTTTTTTTTTTSSSTPTPSLPVSCPVSDNANYTVGSKTFRIECDTDHAGGDIGFVDASGGLPDTGPLWFQNCIAACANDTDCINISLSGSACYLKGTGIGEPARAQGISWAFLIAGGPDLPTPSPAPISCPASNDTSVTSGGKNFTIECGIDRAGGDIGAGQSVARVADANGDLWLQNCVNLCADTPTCVGASLTGSTCYMKSIRGTPIRRQGVSGFVLNAVSTEDPSSPGTAPTDACDRYNLSCPACHNVTLESWDSEPTRNFTMMCGVDFDGALIPSESGEHTGMYGDRKFRNCMEDCAELDECVAATFHGTECFLKNEVGQESVSETVISFLQVA